MRSTEVRSAILVAPGDIRVVTRPRVPLLEGQVRVAVAQCGICDSDIRGWGRPAGQPEQRRLGHEIAGEVVEVGRGVKGRSVSDRVAVWVPSTAEECRVMGLAEEVVAEAWHCVPVASGTPFPFLAEPLGRLLRTLSRSRKVRDGHVVIVGGGFKALLATLLIAEHCRPRSLMVVSSLSDALRLATQVGATHVALPQAFRSGVGPATGGRAADVAFELTGTQPGLDLAQLFPRRGGELLIDRGWTGPRQLNDTFLRKTGIATIDVSQADDPTRVDWMAYALDLLNGGFDPSPLMGPTVPLERIDQAFGQAVRGAGKVVVKP